MKRLSTHLQQVDESYLQHMGHALSFALNLGVASVVCLVHAFLPFLFEKQGSDLVRKLHDRMVVNRHNLTSRSSTSQKQRGEQKDPANRWLSAG